MDKKKLIFQPELLNPTDNKDSAKIDELRLDTKVLVTDTFESQLTELFQAKHPNFKDDEKRLKEFIKSYSQDKSLEKIGCWVFYAWKNTLIHILDKEDFFLVRTCRNNPLITHEEQKKLYDKCIGIVGLSVGNSVALTLAYSGIGNHFKLADFDTLELSNLNRVRSPLSDLGLPKAIVTARAIYEIDPYAEVEIFSEGLTSENFKNFFLENKKIDVLFDECDTLSLKFFLRIGARALGIPLCMASDIGYKAEIAICPFDKNPDAGEMEDVPKVSFDDVVMGLKHAEPLELSETEKVVLICDLLGIENISDEMKDALIKKKRGEIISYPQLGAIATIGGGLSALAMIALEKYPEYLTDKSSFHFLDSIAPPTQEHLSNRRQREQEFIEMFLDQE